MSESEVTPPAGAGRSAADGSPPAPLVVLPGRGVLPADTPVLRADDRGALHGDGVFETLHVRAGRPWLLAPHLDRLVSGAAALDLPPPDRDALAGLAAEACAAWPAGVEGMLRLVVTRGPAGGQPTRYATLGPVDPAIRRQRRAGVRVRTAPLGRPATARPPLAGVKTLSYAANQAARRDAARHGVDDLLWTSTEGYVLEAATANVVWLTGKVLCTVPASSTGILAGVTAGHLLDRAAELGLGRDERLIRPADLTSAGGVWLTSSVRGPVAVTRLDGAPLPAAPLTARLQSLLGFDP